MMLSFSLGLCLFSSRERGIVQCFQCPQYDRNKRWRAKCGGWKEQVGALINGLDDLRLQYVRAREGETGERGVIEEEFEIEVWDQQLDLPVDVLKNMVGDDLAERIMVGVRTEVVELVDQAREVFRGNVGVGLNAVLKLIAMARFRVMEEVTVERGELLEGCADQLPVYIRTERFDTSLFKGISNDLLGLSKNQAAFLPHFLVATKGTGLKKEEAFQLVAKFRALEATYFGWIEFPFNWMIAQLSRVGIKSPKSRYKVGRDGRQGAIKREGNSDATVEKQSVRRITPSRRLKFGIQGLLHILLPTVTQEPTYRSLVLVYRRTKSTINEKSTQLFLAVDSALRNQRNTSKEQAVNKHIEPVNIIFLRDIPWAALYNYLPEPCLSFATMDILRIDILTLAGLFATGMTYVRDFGTVYVGIALAVTAAYYATRILLSVRSSMSEYERRISNDVLEAVVGKDIGAILALADEAIASRFTEDCLILAQIIAGSECLQQARRNAELFLRNKFNIDAVIANGGQDALDDLQKFGIIGTSTPLKVNQPTSIK